MALAILLKDVAACCQNGANSYLVKSANFEKFRHHIRVLTEYWLEVTQLPAVQNG